MSRIAPFLAMDKIWWSSSVFPIQTSRWIFSGMPSFSQILCLRALTVVRVSVEIRIDLPSKVLTKICIVLTVKGGVSLSFVLRIGYLVAISGMSLLLLILLNSPEYS